MSSTFASNRNIQLAPVQSRTEVPTLRSQSHDYRSNVVKRARWDVSSPVPSPPILSVPLPPVPPKQQPSSTFTFACDSSAFQIRSTQPTTSFLKHSRPKFGGQQPSTTARAQRKTPGSHTLSRRHVQVHRNLIDEDEEDDLNLYSLRNDAFSQLRRSAKDQGELFVEKMREWERKQRASEATSSSNNGTRAEYPHSATRNNRGRGLVQPRGRATAEQQSITSSSSCSGSDVSSSRKRPYWSAIEDDDEPEGAEMDWEVVLSSSVANQNTTHPKALTDTSEMAAESAEVDHHVPPSSSSSQLGDIDDDYEDDDDLVFVLNHSAHAEDLHSSTPALSPSTSFLSSSSPPSIPSNSTTFPMSADKVLSDLTQAMDAGTGSLDGGNLSDFVDIDYGKEFGSSSGLGFDIQMGYTDALLEHKVRGVDAGAFWE